MSAPSFVATNWPFGIGPAGTRKELSLTSPVGVTHSYLGGHCRPRSNPGPRPAVEAGERLGLYSLPGLTMKDKVEPLTMQPLYNERV